MPPLKITVDESRVLGRRCRCVDAYLLAGLVVALELHHAVHLGKERIVAAFSNVRSGMELRAALTNDDRPCMDRLAVIPFYAKVLRVAVSTVS
jgi:hypothetical protein